MIKVTKTKDKQFPYKIQFNSNHPQEFTEKAIRELYKKIGLVAQIKEGEE